ncbi:MAG TPA: anaerobic ribonucleoside-triphosphate reductase activating protein, partial [Actinomycetales bacterium]|nr:anaerobic ribonucleoside-triphosphate reductase activating protein [Actinomycetales bacterium]
MFPTAEPGLGRPASPGGASPTAGAPVPADGTARRGEPASSEDLQIAGLVPLSTLDWPGKLSAVVFCQGCPWDCGYCQNASLRACDMPGIVEWAGVMELLRRRRGLLDGVVFSGGEATRQDALVPAMEDARELGFGVALHTAGAYPRRLAE